MPLLIKPKELCRYDLVALGEVMLRFDPGDRRIWTTRHFDVYEGGGEYNVARGLKKCFGLHTAIATAFVDNAVGRLLEDLISQGGVDQSLVKWVPFDGVGRAVLAYAQLWGVPIVGTPRPRSSNAVRSTGTLYSASKACAGFTPVGSSARSRNLRAKLPVKRWKRPDDMERSCPTISTTANRSGNRWAGNRKPSG